MKTLSINDYQLIENIFKANQKNLLKIANSYLSARYDKVIATKDYVMAIGKEPVALVAHLDTVFKNQPKDIYYDREKNVMWSPDGLGADDRAGFFAIMQILKAGYRPTVIFTTEEETGGQGAIALIQQNPQCPADLKYIIELDRRGSNDCVFYACYNLDFEDYIETFGFVTDFGSFSDISIICPTWKIAGVNLSIGYYNEHSYQEILHIGQMLSTIEKVKKMIEDSDNSLYYDYVTDPMLKRTYAGIAKHFEWDPSIGIPKDEWDLFSAPSVTCKECGYTDYDYNLVPIKDLEGGTIHLCPDCFSVRNDIGWCNRCKEAYIKTSRGKSGCCKDCEGKVFDF